MSGSTGIGHHDGRSVWIFARPLTMGGALFSPFAGSTSAGRYPLCHWGVLVTEALTDFENLTPGTQSSTDLELGTMWELQPVNGQNTVTCRSFNSFLLYDEWRHYSAKRIGATRMTDEQINAEGT